jgi:hypothetical protein
MPVPLRLAELLLIGVCACSRPAQPEHRPPAPDAPAPDAGAPPSPAMAAVTNDAGEAPTAPAPDAATLASAPDAGRALSIAELRRQAPASGTHVIEGVITRVVPCPPCPEGAMCKPCVGDHVIVSDGPEAPESHSRLDAGDVIVFVPQPALMRRLTVGQRHQLTVLIRPVKTTALPINDVELIELSP